jgi:hypothetical protein
MLLPCASQLNSTLLLLSRWTNLLRRAPDAFMSLPSAAELLQHCCDVDVFCLSLLQVRIEDPSVTAEDIQFAVQQALFAAERARREGKRLRREDSGVMMSQG